MVAFLAALIMSAGMPALAYTNLLQNPRLETGSLAPRVIDPPTTYWAKSYGSSSFLELRYNRAFAVEQTSDLGYVLAGNTVGEYGVDVLVFKLTASGDTEWWGMYGGEGGDDEAVSVLQSSDGGYVVAGYTNSFGNGLDDMWVLKLDSNGHVIWEYSYGTGFFERANYVEQTRDGGYILGGMATGVVTGHDFWALKIDSNGVVLWDRTYHLGTVTDRRIEAIHETSDSGYILAGSTVLSGTTDQSRAWVIKTDADGDILWDRTYNPFDPSYPSSSVDVEDIRITSDGGYVLFGEATGPGISGQDFWVLKLNSNGDIEWDKAYGGPGEEDAQPIRQTSDGGYIMAGATTSFGAGFKDVWIVKVNHNGDIVWERTYGGHTDDEALGMDLTSDGGYVVAGYTDWFGGGPTEAWVLKIDSSGYIGDCPPIGSSSATVVDTHATIVNTHGTVSSVSEVRVSTMWGDSVPQPWLLPSTQCFESAMPVSSVEGDVLDAPANAVIYVLPDWQTGGGHAKPPGVGPAALSDFTALGFVYGASTNTQVKALDTDSNYFDPATGAPNFSNGVLAVFAGRGVNSVVHYYEMTEMTPPIYADYSTIGGVESYAYFNRQDNVVASLPVSAGQAGTSDMFLVEYFKDANNNNVFIIYGFAWKGTYVGGVFFKDYILPNIGSFTHGWYIYRWDDANGNGLPDPYEVNTKPISFGD